jgi:hypothetical protein
MSHHYCVLGVPCSSRYQCRFAHSLLDQALWQGAKHRNLPIETYCVALCHFGEQCRDGANCTFAHQLDSTTLLGWCTECKQSGHLRGAAVCTMPVEKAVKKPVGKVVAPARQASQPVRESAYSEVVAGADVSKPQEHHFTKRIIQYQFAQDAAGKEQDGNRNEHDHTQYQVSFWYTPCQCSKPVYSDTSYENDDGKTAQICEQIKEQREISTTTLLYLQQHLVALVAANT